MTTLPDRSVEERIAKSVNDLWNALRVQNLDYSLRVFILQSATPEITKHYLKGQ